MVLFKDSLIQCVIGRVQLCCGLMVIECGGEGLELLECPFWLEGLLGLGECGALFIGRHHGRVRVLLPGLAFGVNDGHREKHGR